MEIVTLHFSDTISKARTVIFSKESNSASAPLQSRICYKSLLQILLHWLLLFIFLSIITPPPHPSPSPPRFISMRFKSVTFIDSSFVNCYFEDVSSVGSFFKNCTIVDSFFYNTGESAPVKCAHTQGIPLYTEFSVLN